MSGKRQISPAPKKVAVKKPATKSASGKTMVENSRKPESKAIADGYDESSRQREIRSCQMKPDCSVGLFRKSNKPFARDPLAYHLSFYSSAGIPRNSCWLVAASMARLAYSMAPTLILLSSPLGK
jgi:hypothetical protein